MPTTKDTFTSGGLDALPPGDMARKAESVGVAKAGVPALDLFVLGVLAGAFIGLGAAFATTVGSGTASMPYGVTRLLVGVAFTLGLILVVVAGAELFTGNNLIVMAWASRRISTLQLLRNWGIVYVGNFVGAGGTAVLVWLSKQYTFGGGSVGATALTVAATKVDLGFGQAIVLGALCNALVCLAVWLTYGAHTTADKILAVIPPIAAFVALGFEHSVANMYFVPVALLIKTNQAFVSTTAGLPSLTDLTWQNFLLHNLLPVTIGNIIGGGLMVGAVYWFVYLRKRSTRALTSDGRSASQPGAAVDDVRAEQQTIR
jgi:formate/nitrite transporter